MYPILFEIGGIALPSWHVLFVVGALLALLIARIYNSHLPFALPHQVDRLFAVTYVSGYLGARLFAILIEQDGIKNGIPFVFLQLIQFGAMTFYGGFLAATGAGFLYLRLQKRFPVNLYRAADTCILAGFSALVVGRIGCFLNGDDFGKVVPLSTGEVPWWAVVFPNHQNPMPRYPVQLWEAGAVALLVAFIGWRTWLKREADGMAALKLLGGYGLIRFVIEFYRGDFRGESGWLSPAQWISLGLIIASNLGFILLSNFETKVMPELRK